MTKKLFMMLAVLLPMAGLAQEDPMVVSTESGLVKGIDQEGSVGFLGIPYAKVERFMPPQPVDKWEGIRVCDHWGPQAMQNTWGRKLSEAEMSEQCCVLNVWTTSLTPPVKGEKTPPLNRGGREGSPSTCSPTATLPARGCSYSCSRCCPRWFTISCRPAARTTRNTIWRFAGAKLMKSEEVKSEKFASAIGVALVVAGAILLIVSYLLGWTSSNFVLLGGLFIIILGGLPAP